MKIIRFILFKTILLLLISLNFLLNAQEVYLTGLPLIKNYLPSEYGATPQNWAIVQDKRGVMFFANTGGVLEYDGVNWRLIEIENDVARAISMDENGRIFVGGVDQFGFLEVNQSGKLEYHSLISLLPVENRNFGDIWSIWPSKEGIFFQSASHLFLIKNPVETLQQNKSDNLKLWESQSIFSPAFLVGDTFFITEAGKGLLKLQRDSLVLITGGVKFANQNIYNMLTYPPDYQSKSGNAKILIGAESGFYIYDSLSIKPFKSEADDYIIKNQLYFRGAILNDNTYAFGTQNGGLVIINRDGKLRQIINKTTGLNDNTVWFVYPGTSGELWLGLNNGIAKINYPSSLTLIDSRFGLDGVTYAVNEHQDKIYITTTNGIYWASQSGTPDYSSTFRKVEGIVSESWEILDLNDYQLAATTNGVYKLMGTRATPIKSEWRFAYSFCQSNLDKNLIYVGLHDGLAVLRYVKGEWSDKGRIPGISEIIFHIAEDTDGTIWLCTLNKGLIKLIPSNNNDHTSYLISRYGSEKGVIEKQIVPLKHKSKTVFATTSGFISYDEEQNIFVPEKMFGQRFMKNYFVIDAKNDSDGNIWMMGGKDDEFEVGKISFDKGISSYKNFPPLNGILDNEISFAQYRIYTDKYLSEGIWITANEKLYKFNSYDSMQSSETAKYYALIRSVKTEGDSVIYYGGGGTKGFSEENTEWVLQADLSSIEFSFSSTSYVNEALNKFRYYLEGFDPGWSEWTKENRKEYTNLPPGSYIFRVRAVNIFNELSEESSFGFYIPTPWYKSIWAFFIYAALILAFIWWIVNVRLQFLEKRTVELESIVNERTSEVLAQKNTLEKQAKKLVELDRLKSNFFTNISHEFRTPLTLVKGQIENILDSTSEQKIKLKLKMALSNTKRLHALINQLLELSRLEGGEIRLKISKIDLNKFLKKVLSAFESFAEKRNIKLEFISNIKNLELYFDQEKLEEIFNNLTSNAIKFTPDGGKISLIIQELSDENLIQISVKDSGVGISSEALPHIFERFYQVDSSQTRKYEGTGIGLAIVKELVELHQGSIKVESSPGNGTEFIIYLHKGSEHFHNLPFVEFIKERETEKLISSDTHVSFDKETKLFSTEAENVQEDIGSQKNVVLVVEDNSEMRAYIQEHLISDYKVIEAKNGEDGIKKAFDSIPDIIITDVMMPVMNGYDLTKKIKKDQKTSHIPIIMLTAKADEESKLSGLDIGVDDYIVKPFSKKELLARVGNLIKLRTLLKERYKGVSALSINEIEAKPIDKEFLEKVFSCIKAHLEDNQFGITKLSNEIGMSVSQLNRKLNALIHQTAGKLIRTTRLDYASQLLKNKAGNISEIAYRTGFSDTPGFTHSFKEKFGCSPSEYLKSIDNLSK